MKQTYATPGTDARIEGITCVSSSDCLAVGQFDEPSDGFPAALMLRFDGRGWRYQPIPQPRSGNGLLYDVSCSSADACTAVGLADPGPRSAAFGRSIAYRFDGTRWTLSHPPDPPNVGFGELTLVDCATATSCVAPSTVTDRDGLGRASADVWQDGVWRLTPLPVPTASRKADSGMSGVSCVSADACIAVGSWWSTRSNALRPLLDVWDGTSWHRRHGPLPVPADGVLGTATLIGISCWSSTTCLAVGEYATQAGATVPLVEERQVVG